jgi:hypothetical protein
MASNFVIVVVVVVFVGVGDPISVDWFCQSVSIGCWRSYLISAWKSCGASLPPSSSFFSFIFFFSTMD